MGWDSITNINEFNKCITKINKWHLKGVKILNIITQPYNSATIFSSIINEVQKKGGRIIYIWGKNEVNKELMKSIRTTNADISYGIIEEGEGLNDINFVRINNIGKIKGFYDLCIIDDISTFSQFSTESIREVVEYMYIYSGRIILYSIEKVHTIGQKIELPILNSNKPFVEPRSISTRIDLSKDIPYSLYDYLIWFKETRKKVVIFVPTEQLVTSTYELYKNLLKLENSEISMLIKNQKIKSVINLTKVKDRATFIITNSFGDYLREIKRMDSIILFSDDIHFSYKKIIYLCGEIGKESELPGELLLVSKQESHNMERAKWIARSFNKKLWEQGFLKD